LIYPCQSAQSARAYFGPQITQIDADKEEQMKTAGHKNDHGLFAGNVLAECFA